MKVCSCSLIIIVLLHIIVFTFKFETLDAMTKLKMLLFHQWMLNYQSKSIRSGFFMTRVMSFQARYVWDQLGKYFPLCLFLRDVSFRWILFCSLSIAYGSVALHSTNTYTNRLEKKPQLLQWQRQEEKYVSSIGDHFNRLF